MKSSPEYIIRLFTGGLSRCSFSMTHSTKLKTGGTGTASPSLVRQSIAIGDGLDLDQQMRMRKLMHRHGGAGGRPRVLRKELGPDLVVAAEVVHRDQVRRRLHQVAQVGAVSPQDRADVLQDGA